ncbi:MAG: serine/threonine protein kinase [Deltaproteobacteria bacterium]|nr:serine/threonine protein kinase [Deltaproteobacteria bacterium]
METDKKDHGYVGKYRIVKPLHTGGMGEIFLAEETGNSGEVLRNVAVKMILEKHSESLEFEQMFLDEVGITAQLTHPNIVHILNTGKDTNRGQYYLILEYVQGMNLREILRHCELHGIKFPPFLAAYIAAQVCSALDYAHRKTNLKGEPLHIIHRDIDPANVMVSLDGAVKVLDFGIAKARGRMADTTTTGSIKGKIAYMSPEHISGKEIDHRTDIFSLGVVLWELLCGRSLFRSEGEVSTMHNVINAKIDPPSRHNPDVPKALDTIVSRALSRSLKKRYSTAREFYDDLIFLLRTYSPTTDAYALSDFVRVLASGEIGKVEPDTTQVFEKHRRSSRRTAVSSTIQDIVGGRWKWGFIALFCGMAIGSGVYLGKGLNTSELIAPSTTWKSTPSAPTLEEEIEPPTSTPSTAQSIVPPPDTSSTPPTETAKTVQVAKLVVNVEPRRATIRIDGKDYPVTDGRLVKEFENPPDSVRVAARIRGGEWGRKTANLVPGESRSIRLIAPTPKPTPYTPPAPRPSPSPPTPAPPAVEHESSPTPASTEPATLAVASNPSTFVYVNGTRIGSTPRGNIQLNSGSNSVRLVNDEYGISYSTTVEGVPGKKQVVRQIFKGTLNVSTCARCSVKINGSSSVGPTTVQIPAGGFRVIATNPDTSDVKTRSGTLKAGESKSISLTF